MVDIRFLRGFGWTTVQEGGLIQFLEILANGTVAMLTYIGFKICEAGLVHRYHNWQSR